MTERGARELARRIAAYWAARGRKVDIRVEKVEVGRHDAGVWAVRSDRSLDCAARGRDAARRRGASAKPDPVLWQRTSLS